MTEYDQQPPRDSDHSRVVRSGAWLGAIVFTSAFGWLDTAIPHWLGFLLNWTVVLAVCYAMACWKRAWYAWLAFWGMAAAALLCGSLSLAGVMKGDWSAASWVMACVIVFIWYWLVRMPRLQPTVQAVARTEIHVFHHVINYPAEPGWRASVADPGRRVIQGSAARAVGPQTVQAALTAPVTSTVAKIRKARNGSRE
jgi:hypothetical protein